MPLPRAAGRTNKSSRYNPGLPRNVEYVAKNTAKPTGTSSWLAITTSATGRKQNSVERSSSSVAVTSCDSLS